MIYGKCGTIHAAHRPECALSREGGCEAIRRAMGCNRCVLAGTATGIPTPSAFFSRVDTKRGEIVTAWHIGNLRNLRPLSATSLRSVRSCRRECESVTGHYEFDTPFCPVNPLDASRILLRSVSEAFEVSAASIAYEPGFFERMRISPYP